MRLKHKLPLLLVLAAALPVAVAGWSAIRVAERGAIRDAEDAERRAARASAAHIAGDLDDLRALLRLYARHSFDFAALGPTETVDAERLLYGLDERITIVSVLDETGAGRAPSYYARRDTASAPDRGASRRAAISPAALAEHATRLPLGAAVAAGEAQSAVYRALDGAPRVALAARADDGEVRAHAVLAVEVALERLVESAAPGAAIVDGDGQLVTPTARPFGGGRTGSPTSWVEPRSFVAAGADDGGHETLVTLARVPGYEFGIASTRPLAEILAPARALRRRIAAWVCGAALLALLLGLATSRSITARLAPLELAARAIGEGALGHRVTDSADDELGHLGSAFNQMAAQLEASHSEVRRWNADLERKVREKTADLRLAIDQLLLAHRLAAIGQLGAGVAHEINNPLTFLVGALELAARAPEPRRGELLVKCDAAARRIQEVVAGLLQLSEPRAGERRSPVDVSAIADSALRLSATQLEEAGIEITRAFDPDLPRVLADPAEVMQALVHIVKNAREAMPSGGRLRIETAAAMGDKLVLVSICDTGAGVPQGDRDRLFDAFFTTKAHAGHKGLGLSLAYRVVKDHGGAIVVDDAPGGGARFTLRLPALPKRLSLA